MWILHQGLYNTVVESTSAPESPVFQWGLRSGTTCVSAHMGIGDAADGAGGHWSCDFGFNPAASTYKPSTAGYTPTVNQWHHIVVTYPGGTNGNETIYVDGVANNWIVQSPNIAMPPNMYLGAWFNSATSTYFGGEFTLGALRMHDHVLAPGDVYYNYQVRCFGWGCGGALLIIALSLLRPVGSPI